MQRNLILLFKLFMITCLFFVLLPSVSAVDENISYGETKIGSITYPGEIDIYTFYAERGDVILFKSATYRTTSKNGTLMLRVILYNQSGEQLVSKSGLDFEAQFYTIESNW